MSAILAKFKSALQEVYGTFPTFQTIKTWKPKRFSSKGRYLWTDAFGVCNFITLYQETNDSSFLEMAEALINDVHNVLGKQRDGKAWLGDANEENPTLGGLRIGKEKDEGKTDGDGQYYHYLTKWMFALNRMTLATGDAKYNKWAIQLAKSIHPHFVIRLPDGHLRMYWKISIDMSHPWERSEGHLDPYDGFVTYRILQRTAQSQELEDLILQMEAIVHERSLLEREMYDPLDIGEALWIAHWFRGEDWANILASKSAIGLNKLYNSGELHRSHAYRLAFREFGTILGVRTNPNCLESEWGRRAQNLLEYWEPHIYRRDKDITPVMYCSALIPGVWKNEMETVS